MLARTILVCVLAAGCGKQLNVEYCASHPDDGDCRGADLVMIDAPQGCTMNAMCTEAGKPVCEVATGNCVQCVPNGDVAACTGATTVCGEDRQCHGCLVDTHCTLSAVCLPTGTCANDGEVLYAAPQGTGDCSRAMPCTLTQAVSMLSTTKHIIKMTTTAGTDYAEPPVTINKPALVIGTGTTLTPAGAGPAITVTAAVEIVGITINAATTDGISCAMPGSLTLRRSTVIGSGGYGVSTSKCDVTIERNRFMRNVAGGLFLDTGKLEVRNNFVGPGNGNGGTTTGSVRINKGTGRIVFNTVSGNNSENGGGARVGAMSCAASAALVVAHNILASNGPANGIRSGDCQYGTTNYESTSVTDVHFASMTDFHLTAISPTTNPIIREDPDADKDCRLNGVDGAYIDDIDGQPRPVGLCDRGADEYVP